ncbi:MAG: NAD(P)/FAD-dependent oxidoreductase [Treponema sp.]|nr:NAD(P)/FAD-dependent oxidoreductase [Treponema sp.]
MKSNNVLIIGAGIAGLTAGIYAQKSGFNVTIYESHHISGGNCTSWRRKGYLFEGGLHWLTGSSTDQMLNKVWRETGVLTDGKRITHTDPFLVCDWQGQQICLYRDVMKLAAHFNAVSPEDKPRIRALCRDIVRFTGFNIPVMDIGGLKVEKKAPITIGKIFTMLPSLLRIGALSKLTVAEYAARFKHPAIRLLLSSVITPEFDAVSLLATLGCFASGDGGYIEGGSLALAANMAKCFEDLGGRICCGKKAEKVQVKDGKACGLIVGGMEIPGDAVIAASDTLAAIDNLFDPPLREKWTLAMRANTNQRGALLMCTFIGIGVETDLSGSPEHAVFTVKNPFEYAGKNITELGYKHYAEFSGYAPKGCTAITIILIGDTYDYWKQAREQGHYDKCKKELIDHILTALEEQLPAIKGKAAVWDIATPLTYERYCGTFHGSWMTVTPPGAKRLTYAYKSRQIGNLYFAGQRIMPPGGTPVAVSTGRTAAQYLCRDFGVVFKS